MLALLLLLDRQTRYQVHLPMYHCLTDDTFAGPVQWMNEFWNAGPAKPTGKLDLLGGSFWMRVS
jgi:hypothetical protein